MRAPSKTPGRARQLRRKMTLPEVALWQALRKGRLAHLRFRRQHPVGPYILDFYLPSARLAIEIDSSAHDAEDRLRHDERRIAWLIKGDVTVFRIAAKDILKDEALEDVLRAIERLAAPSTACGGPPPPLGRGGT